MRFAFLLLALLLLSTSARAQADAASEIQQIEEAVGLYFRGVMTRDEAAMRQAFHPDFLMFFVRDGALQRTTLDEWIARMQSAPPPAEPAQERRYVTSIDYAGDTASVRAVAELPDVLLIDYINLVKVDGRWQIINKIFHRQAR